MSTQYSNWASCLEYVEGNTFKENIYEKITTQIDEVYLRIKPEEVLVFRGKDNVIDGKFSDENFLKKYCNKYQHNVVTSYENYTIEISYLGTLKHGSETKTLSNGEISSIKQWKWNQLDGETVTKANNFKRIERFVGGKRHGDEDYYRGNFLFHQIQWKFDKQDGFEKAWFNPRIPESDGNLNFIQSWKNGIEDGIASYYYENGAPLFEEHWVGGKLHGKVKEWFPDGTLYSTSRYENGKKHGLSEFWYESSYPESIEVYNSGRLISKEHFPNVFFQDEKNIDSSDNNKNSYVISSCENENSYATFSCENKDSYTASSVENKDSYIASSVENNSYIMTSDKEKNPYVKISDEIKSYTKSLDEDNYYVISEDEDNSYIVNLDEELSSYVKSSEGDFYINSLGENYSHAKSSDEDNNFQVKSSDRDFCMDFSDMKTSNVETSNVEISNVEISETKIKDYSQHPFAYLSCCETLTIYCNYIHINIKYV
jgi:antitoxin component YwqK of YwqJK toxin-antitoxin module